MLGWRIAFSPGGTKVRSFSALLGRTDPMSSRNGDIHRDARANDIRRRGLIGSAAAAGAMAFATTRAMAQTGIADLVLLNGRIHTMDGAGAVTDAVAIQAGRFIAIGAQAAAMAARAARTVDLGGK